MSSQAAKLLEQALKLPQEARAALAGKLILSLDDRIDDDAEAAWAAEIDRRLARVDAGKTTSLSWEEVEDHILKTRRARSRR